MLLVVFMFFFLWNFSFFHSIFLVSLLFCSSSRIAITIYEEGIAYKQQHTFFFTSLFCWTFCVTFCESIIACVLYAVYDSDIRVEWVRNMLVRYMKTMCSGKERCHNAVNWSKNYFLSIQKHYSIRFWTSWQLAQPGILRLFFLWKKGTPFCY